MIVQCIKHGTTFEVMLGPTGCQFCLSEQLEKDQKAMIEHLSKIPPVDRSARVLTDNSPVTEDHREIISGGVRDGQQKGYVVLSEAERSKGFVRPYRDSYVHLGILSNLDTSPTVKPIRKGGCGSITSMGRSLAETYARDPGFYSGTFCATCKTHFPLDQFVWSGTNEQVGS